MDSADLSRYRSGIPISGLKISRGISGILMSSPKSAASMFVKNRETFSVDTCRSATTVKRVVA